MLILLPGTPVPIILGTNKFASCCGTTFAVQRYWRVTSRSRWATVLPAALTAFVFSFLGSRTVTLLNTAFLRPVVLVLLVLCGDLRFFRQGPRVNPRSAARPAEKSKVAGCSHLAPASVSTTASSARAPAGCFLIFLFVRRFRVRFSRGVGLGQGDQLGHQHRLSHLLRLEREHHISIRRQPMARSAVSLAQRSGARLAIAKGSRFVRIFFLVVVAALIAKLAQSIIAP